MICKWEDQIAGFLSRLGDGVHENEVRAGDGRVVKFAFVGMICANRVEVCAYCDVAAIENRLGGGGRRVDMSAPRTASLDDAAGCTRMPSRADISAQNASRRFGSRL